MTASSEATSIRAYQTSRYPIPAYPRIFVRYDSTQERAAPVQSLPESPTVRAATTMLAASRFTSHSNGAGSVSSKSFTSKTRLRSGCAKIPKFERWQSPQASTSIPLLGDEPRSAAITAADPRRNANGEAAMRP